MGSIRLRGLALRAYAGIRGLASQDYGLGSIRDLGSGD